MLIRHHPASSCEKRSGHEAMMVVDGHGYFADFGRLSLYGLWVIMSPNTCNTAALLEKKSE